MIFLINPFITSAERYGKDIGDIGGHQMPLGIFYLAAYLKKAGLTVRVIDAEAEGLVHEDVVEELKSAGASIIGITSTTVAFRNTRALAEMSRQQLPHAKIVIGGPHMTAMPLPTMATGAFDFGIVREGEVAFLKLVRHLVSGEGKLEDIPSLYWPGRNDAPKIDYIADMDSIPFPARELCRDVSVYKPPVGAFRKEPVVSIMTSRGCPYECIFCDNNTFGRKTRFFSAEYVAHEIKEVITEYGAREIAFLDDTFVLGKARLRKIFELLNDEHISFPWTCMTRVNNLDYATLKFMRDQGCWQIRIGIESGNQQVLDFIKKGITLEQIENVARWGRKLGLRVSGFFMIGHHIDTPQTIEETIKFATSLPLTDVIVTINTPIPGTQSYEKAQAYGTYQEDDWTSLNYWTPVFVPKNLTRELILKKQAEFYRRFYTRPSVILGQIAKIRSWAALKMMVKNALLGLRFIGGARPRS